MVIEGPGDVLHDRRSEREVLARLLEAVRGGQSRVLVMCGEPGVGKTALLGSATESASGFWVLRTVGVESEMELTFAALQQFCAPLLDRLDRLPGPQQDALAVAFGLRAGNPPDRFLVGLAVLSLLSEVAEEQPLLCVVDDAQWLDRASAQALVFVARRLLAESVALIFATRDPGEELEGLPKLAVEGLPDGDARALLGSALGVPLDERVRQRIVAETRGNPLALLELPRGLTPAELAGGFGLLDAPGLSGRIEDGFRARLAGLPAETQRLLLVAAAEPVGDPVLVWRAAGRLGIGVERGGRHRRDCSTIGDAGDVSSPAGPLGGVPSGVAGGQAGGPPRAGGRDRSTRSTPIAAPGISPRRRRGPMRTSLPSLSARRAALRPAVALAAAAAFLERAAALTLDPARRADRALAAAQAKHQAGALDAAPALACRRRVGAAGRAPARAGGAAARADRIRRRAAAMMLRRCC